MEFNLDSRLKLRNGVSLTEIANELQNFTDMYLYMDESLTLKGVHKLEDIPYSFCKLLKVENGFLMYEKDTDRLVKIYSKECMEYLSKEIDFTNFQQYDTDDCFEGKQEEKEETENFSEKEEKEEQENFSEQEEKEEQENFSEQEEQEEKESSEENYSKKEFHDRLLEAFNIEKEMDLSIETVFRIFMRDYDDLECLNAICLTENTFNNFESIDLKQTIINSFSSYLKENNYDVKVEIIFHDNTFAEMYIYTDRKIDSEIIKEIEKNANLEVNDEIIFFILRYIQSISRTF